MPASSRKREIPLSSAFSTLFEEAISVYSPGPKESPVDTPKFRALLAQMVSFASCFTENIVGLKIYSAGMRSVVVQVMSQAADGEKKIVVKHFRRKDSASNSGGFGYLREKHGLTALNSLVPDAYSALLGFDDVARMLAIEQIEGYPLVLGMIPLGSPGSFSFRQDDELQVVLRTWVDFWAGLMRSPAQESVQQEFVATLADADSVATSPGSLTSPQLAIKGLEKLCMEQGISLDSEEFNERKTQVESIIYPAAEDTLLTSGDFSPANVLVDSLSTPQAVMGIDAEGTALHHWALAVAEFLLGFPSCPWAPLHDDMVQSEVWQSAVARFYRQVCSNNLEDTPLDDARVCAAVLTVQCILAEQTAWPAHGISGRKSG